MARNLTGTDTVSNASFGGVAQSGAISQWIKPHWNSGDSQVHRFFFFPANVATDGPSFQKFSDNNIYCGFSSQGRVIVADTGLFANGVWAHWLFSWSTSGATLYKNGASVGSVGAGTITGASTFAVGNGTTGSTSTGAEAAIAEFAYWGGVSLTAREISALAAGANPSLIRPTALGFYLPLYGLASPEPDLSGQRLNGTLTGTTLVTGPPVALSTPYKPSYLVSAVDVLMAQALL